MYPTWALSGKFGVQGFVIHMHPGGWDPGLETQPDKQSVPGRRALRSIQALSVQDGDLATGGWLLLGQVIGQTRMGTWSRPHWARPSCPGGAGGTESEVPSVSQGGKTCS